MNNGMRAHVSGACRRASLSIRPGAELTSCQELEPDGPPRSEPAWPSGTPESAWALGNKDSAEPPVQRRSAEGQENTATPIGEKAEVSNAREASWEHVFEKAAQEDLMGECHRPPLVVMSVVLPAERHVGVSKIDEPVVGDCDAVRVLGQIVQNVFGTTKGAFRDYSHKRACDI